MVSNDIKFFLENFDIQKPVKIQTTAEVFFPCNIEKILDNSLVVVDKNKAFLINFEHIVYIGVNTNSGIKVGAKIISV